MNVRFPLQIKHRTTLIHDVYQQVERLILTDECTFRAVTLRGFMLKSTRSGTISNQQITHSTTVTTDTLILVHARTRLYVNAEVPEGNGNATLLLTLDAADTRTDQSLLHVIESVRTDRDLPISTPKRKPPELNPDGSPKPSRTEKARAAKKAKREAALKALNHDTQTATPPAALMPPPATVPDPDRTRSAQATPPASPAPAPAAPSSAEQDSAPTAPSSAEQDSAPTANGTANQTPRAPRGTRAASPRAKTSTRTSATDPLRANFSGTTTTLLNTPFYTDPFFTDPYADPVTSTPEPTVTDLPIVPIERHEFSAPFQIQPGMQGAAAADQNTMEADDDDIPEDLPF